MRRAGRVSLFVLIGAVGFLLVAGAITSWRMLVLALLLGIPFGIAGLWSHVVRPAVRYALDHFVWGGFLSFDAHERAHRRWEKAMIAKGRAQDRAAMHETRSWDL